MGKKAVVVQLVGIFAEVVGFFGNQYHVGVHLDNTVGKTRCPERNALVLNKHARIRAAGFLQNRAADKLPHPGKPPFKHGPQRVFFVRIVKIVRHHFRCNFHRLFACFGKLTVNHIRMVLVGKLQHLLCRIERKNIV